MNKFGTLLKYDFIMMLGLGKLKAELKKGKAKFTGKALLGAFLVLAVLGIIFMYIYMLADVLKMTGMLDLMPIFLQVISGLMVFLFTFYSAGGTLFSFKDYDLLLSMPVKPRAVLASKLVSLTVSQLLVSCVIMVPGIVVYAVLGGLSPLGWVFGIISVLFSPLVPVVLASIISAVIAAISSRLKFKNLVSIILSFAFFALIMIGSFNLQGLLASFAANAGGLAEGIRQYMPFFYYYGSAMVTGSVLELLIALAISAAVFALFVWVFSIGYKRINQLLNERSSRANYKLTALKAGSPMRALFFKELKTYASTPIYIFNTAFGALLMFILTIAAAFFGGETMAQLLELPVVADMMGPMFAALLSLLAVMSCTTCSSISLEGKAFYLVKAAPVPVWKVFAAKISINLLITAVPAVICAVILYAVLGLSVQALLILLVLPVLYSFYISFMGLLMNLLSPKMEFTTPAQVVKQSAATVYAMLAGFAGVAVPVALFLLLKLSVDFLWTYLWLVCGGVLLVDILLAAVLGTVGKKLYAAVPA